MNVKVILILILLLGFLLRMLDINNNPPSLYGDELTIVYDAYSILKTGKDQLGNSFPLTFAMGAGRPAGYVYGSIPFVAIFGPGALGVRMLSILSGLGIILLLYLLGKKLFDKKVGLAAGAIAVFSPWDISLSRGGFEAHFALFLALLGLFLFIKAKENPYVYIFSALSFGATLHTYPTYKLSLLLFLPLLVWFQGGPKIINKKFLAGIALFIILGGLSLSQTFIGGSENRFSDINIFSHSKLKDSIEQKINFERSISMLPQGFVRTFHNKGVEYAKVFIENYLQNFSLDFLVIHGDGHPRHNMATMGQIFLAAYILFFIGLISFWTKYKKILTLLLLWLFISPIPTAIVDVPHALRSSFMLPPIIMISALGAVTLINRRSKIFLGGIVILFLIQFIFFAQKLYFLAPNEYSRFWSDPAKLASEKALENKDNFEYIILSDRIDNIEFAFPVYAKIDPKQVISQNKEKYNLLNYQFKKFDNVYIGNIADGDIKKFLNSLDGSILFIGSPSSKDYLTDVEVDVEVIEGSDKKPALVLEKVFK